MFDDSMYNSDCDWDINKAAYKVIIMFPSIMACGFFIEGGELWDVEDFVKGLEGENIWRFIEVYGVIGNQRKIQ